MLFKWHLHFTKTGNEGLTLGADEGTLLLTCFINGVVGGVCTIQLFCLNLLAVAEYWLTQLVYFPTEE